MKISLKWLADYVETGAEPREYAHRMVMTGSKVETLEFLGEDISGVVAGRIISVEKHPNADRLTVCSVDVGKGEPVQIVTGAPNVYAGMTVPVALHNARLPGDAPGGKKIESGKLRGVLSQGMLCSLEELGLTLDDYPYAIEDGIFGIEEPCEPGDDIRAVLGLDDVIVDFEITPNRPDCMSLIGLARESAAAFGRELKLKRPSPSGGGAAPELRVAVMDPDLCPRYSARAVTGVKIAPSPAWMRRRLRAAGIRPINNIVDITNYVLLEYGQPMHAFDYRDITGGEIVIRRAAEGEGIVTLDGRAHTLEPSILVIADSARAMAVAGVMGGENSGIRPDTQTVVFESACFNGPSIRRAARKLGIRTEASALFEKGLDSENTLPALDRACELCELIGAGTPAGAVIDANMSGYSPRSIPFDPEGINRLLGTDLPAEKIKALLSPLGFAFVDAGVLSPSYRRDVRGTADLAEETARMVDYNSIPSTLFSNPAFRPEACETFEFRERIAEAAVSLGFYEIYTYSFMNPKQPDLLRLSADAPERKFLRIQNPIGEETAVMRTTLAASMLEVIRRNSNNRVPAGNFFELGKIFIPRGEDELPNEKYRLCLGMYGESADFFSLKGAVGRLLDSLRIAWEVEATPGDGSFHPGRCAAVKAGGRDIGVMGEVHPLTLDNFGIGCRAWMASLDADALMEMENRNLKYAPLPKYPPVSRDLALVCPTEMPAGFVESLIRSAGDNYLENVELFDVYSGAQTGEGRKSLAYSLTLRAGDHTLTEDEINGAIGKITALLGENGIEQRK